MAKLEDILRREESRTALSDYNVIHLFQEGSFLRAYEFSAWLCHRFIHEFSPTHRKNKGVEKDIIFVGFPLTSLQKWTPDGSECRQVEEKHFEMMLRQELDDDGVMQLREGYAKWKESVPLASPSSKGAEVKTRVQSETLPPVDADGLIRSIMEFPLESKNMLECLTFLSSLRQQAISIFSNTNK